MKIVKLTSENFKRLGLVEITPEGHLITIGGENGAGKSSALDSIYVALKGRASFPPKPIRQGEEKCTIRLDMGEIIVTRNFHAKEDGDYTDTLKVESSDGLRYQKPQQVLDALLGEIGFDPFEFMNLKPKDQAARLLEMVPLSIDLDEFNEADAADLTNRRDINREANALKAQIEGIPREDVPETAPDREALTDQLGNAANVNAGINQQRDQRERHANEITRKRDNAEMQRRSAADARKQAAELIKRAEDFEASAKSYDEAADKDVAEQEAWEPLPEYVDTDAIREELRTAEAVLATIERQKNREALKVQWQAKADASQALTEALKTRDEERNKALAEAEMPVPGLAFAIGEDGKPVLMWEGLPFDKDQINTATQLRVSTAIGMACNPRLRVLRISNASLLDKKSLAMLAEMAELEDFQVLAEVVSTDESVGIILENGAVVGGTMAPKEEPQPEGETEEQPKPKAKKGTKAKPANEGETLL